MLIINLVEHILFVMWVVVDMLSGRTDGKHFLVCQLDISEQKVAAVVQD